jgi:hypothetical protein
MADQSSQGNYIAALPLYRRASNWTADFSLQAIDGSLNLQRSAG